MRTRARLLFILLAVTPLALLGWLGTMLIRQEQSQTHEAWMATLQERLLVVENGLSLELQRLADALDSALLETDMFDAALRELPRGHPLVRYAFLTDAEGRLQFPRMNGTSSGDAGFLRRTMAVWESGIRFGDAKESTGSDNGDRASSSLGGTFIKKSEGRIADRNYGKASPRQVVSASGWHVWFYGDGPQMLFWQKREDGRVIGVEVEMAAVISQLVNCLTSQNSPAGDGLLRLTSADGTMLLHQWGAGDAKTVSPPVAYRACPAPLSMWQISYSPGLGEGPRNNAGAILLGTAAAAFTLLGLTWLFYRENQREMREARKRVSFVNQVSHELKTPLTNIRLYAEMAQQQIENENAEAAHKHLAVVEAETSRLSRLIHNVLTFARQQRDELGVNPREASLDEVACRSVALWRPGLEARNFTVVNNFNAPTPFSFDPDAVEQILGNLLSNVEKYAASACYVGITTGQDGTHAYLTVEDRGPGIPARQQESVFQPFVRLHGELTEGVSGTGIGLSISRHLAELQGGTLEVGRLGSQGAKFILRLPLHTAKPL